MGYDERREILERLEALERRLGARREEHGGGDGGRHGDRHRDRGHHRRGDRGDRGGGSQEKRIIDTIVHLVSERVAHIVDERQGRSGRQNDGGGEKRIVDLIVGLVSEHVAEIVRSELDRRFGPADGQAEGDERGASGPPAPRPGGPPQREPL